MRHNEERKLLVKTNSKFAVNCVNEWMPQWRQNGWKKANGEQVDNFVELQKLDGLVRFSLDEIKLVSQWQYNTEIT